MPASPLPRVVVVGAGFGGLACARRLARAPVEVWLLDRNNYHLFTPLLYQVASSLLNPADIAYPVRTVFRRQGRARVRRVEVTGVDFERHAVRTRDGVDYAYDRLVLAAGSTTNFYGNPRVEAVAFGLKDLPEAMELRNHVLTCFEEAVRRPEAERGPWLTFVVAGGGPTGVEYAGALSELVRLVLRRDFPDLDFSRVRIVLVELYDRVLGFLRPELSAYAMDELHRRGIEVRLSCRIDAAGPEGVTLAGGETIAAKTLVWAAGVKPAGLAAELPVPRSRGGRIETDEYLRVRGRTEAYAIGDLACFRQDGRELPMLAPPAMQQGRHAARNILRDLAGKPLLPFRYRDRGTMATIGRSAGVAQTRHLSLRGKWGWLAWLALHLWFLIGFRNRLLVLLGWASDYFRYDRPVRIIARARGREDRP